ncbi:hypothetical protein, partial, partial [Parasitella parasitica]
MAMIRQLGTPTLFVTISAAETKWPELLVALKKLVDGVIITEDDADQLEDDEKRRLIQSDPVTCASYFDKRFRALKGTWTTDNAINAFSPYIMGDYYYRVEFQHRGSPHVHMLIYLKDAPILDNTLEDPEAIASNVSEIEAFVDKIMSAKTVTLNPQLNELISSRQLHRHTRTCYKGGSRKLAKQCRFNIPFFPMDKTRLLTPFEDRGSRADIRALAREIRRYLDNNIDAILGSTMTFSDFLGVFGTTEENYILAVRSTLRSSKVVLARKPQDILTNNYNPKLLLLMGSNCDLQFVVNPYACCAYIV